jgi:hypothetical protein
MRQQKRMETLKQILLAPDVRPKVVRGGIELVDAEVSRKSGLTGLAIKAGYAVVRKLNGGTMIQHAVDWLLDDFVRQVEPFFAEYARANDAKQSAPGLRDFFLKRADAVAEALLAITDGHAKHGRNVVIVKTYEKLRPMAKREVVAAVPGIAGLIARFAIQ